MSWTHTHACIVSGAWRYYHKQHLVLWTQQYVHVWQYTDKTWTCMGVSIIWTKMITFPNYVQHHWTMHLHTVHQSEHDHHNEMIWSYCISQHCQTTYVHTAPLHHAYPHTHQWKTSTPSTNQNMTITLSVSLKAMVKTSSLLYTSVASKGCIPKTESFKHTHIYTQTHTHW